MGEKRRGMTNRERIEALLTRERPDRIPVWANARGFFNVYAGGSILDAYENLEFSLAAQREVCQELDWVFFPTMSNPTALAKEFGGDIKLPNSDFSQAPMIIRFPAETEEDVWSIKKPDMKLLNGNLIRVLGMILLGRHGNSLYKKS